jgi:hypothetical protein
VISAVTALFLARVLDANAIVLHLGAHITDRQALVEPHMGINDGYGLRSSFSAPRCCQFCDRAGRLQKGDVWRWYPDAVIKMIGKGCFTGVPGVKTLVRCSRQHAILTVRLASGLRVPDAKKGTVEKWTAEPLD